MDMARQQAVDWAGPPSHTLPLLSFKWWTSTDRRTEGDILDLEGKQRFSDSYNNIRSIFPSYAVTNWKPALPRRARGADGGEGVVAGLWSAATY